MTWYRIEGTMPQHEKYTPLSDAAFRLAITAGAWCASMMTDGRLPKRVVPGLTRAPAARQLSKAVQELVDARIWDESDSDSESFHIHDFLDWNMSRKQWEAKKAAGSAGGKAKALANQKQPPKQTSSKRLASARDSLEQNASTCSSVPLADSDSDSDSDKREIPLSPPGGKRTREKKTAGESLCPERSGFAPTEATLAAAAELSVDLWRHFDTMHDWSHAKGKKAKDWNASLRNFMRGSPDKFRVASQPVVLTKLPLGGEPGQEWHQEPNGTGHYCAACFGSGQNQ